MNYAREQLFSEANNEFKLHKNSWETAMFQALAASDWYCQGGFRHEVYDPTAFEMNGVLEALK